MKLRLHQKGKPLGGYNLFFPTENPKFQPLRSLWLIDEPYNEKLESWVASMSDKFEGYVTSICYVNHFNFLKRCKWLPDDWWLRETARGSQREWIKRNRTHQIWPTRLVTNNRILRLNPLRFKKIPKNCCVWLSIPNLTEYGIDLIPRFGLDSDNNAQNDFEAVWATHIEDPFVPYKWNSCSLPQSFEHTEQLRMWCNRTGLLRWILDVVILQSVMILGPHVISHTVQR